MIETAFESWEDVFFYKKKISKNCNFFLHLLILYCTAKRYIKPKMCTTMIFMTFDDFLTFDNIQKKVNWCFSASSYRKSMIESAFESWNIVLLQKKILIEIFCFFLIIHTLLSYTAIKKIFALFHQKMSKNADFWKLKNIFQC